MDLGVDLRKQVEFIMEADKMKSIYRQTFLTDRSRNEDDAEHSWHLALMAITLHGKYAPPGSDLLHILKMVLIHDIVEIDAGDTFVYDTAAHADKAERENAAAERLFGILPSDQAEEMRALWNEFEERTTPEAAFASALDRIQPILSNYYTDGGAWKIHNIRASQVYSRNAHIKNGSPDLWKLADELIKDSVKLGYLIND